MSGFRFTRRRFLQATGISTLALSLDSLGVLGGAALMVRVKLTSAARSEKEELRPGQVMICHAWEPYQFEKWKGYDMAIPGMIKWLDLAAGYGHLN